MSIRVDLSLSLLSSLSLIAASCVMASGAALAGDGTLEINETCALQTGCFPGDAAGYPVTIASPGSYVLTSSLQLPGLGVDGIVANSSVADVRVDLNGFSISGPNTCSGQPNSGTFSCGSGSGGGVRLPGPRSAVFGGSVSGVGSIGIEVGEGARVRDVQVSDVGSHCVAGNISVQVEKSSLRNCGGNGIDAQTGSSAMHNTLSLIGGNGIELTGIAVENSVINCGGLGIWLQGGGVAVDNNVTYSTSYGIEAGTFGVAAARGNFLLLNNGGGPQYSPNVVATGANVCSNNTVCP